MSEPSITSPFDSANDQSAIGRAIQRIKVEVPEFHYRIESGAELEIPGKLVVNRLAWGMPRASSLMLHAGSRMTVRGGFCIGHGLDIVCFAGGKLELGSGFCNIRATIRCSDEITIGDGVVFGHDLTILDWDGHRLFEENLMPGNPPIERVTRGPINIGNHVWVGTRVTILKNVTIGDGAVIAAGAVVNRDVLPGTLVGGVPAKRIRDVKWK